MENRDKVVGEYYAKEFNNFVRKLTRKAGSEQNAEDIVQDAFYKALKYFHAFDPSKKKFQTWFGVILVNCYNDFKNKELNFGMQMEIEEHHLVEHAVKPYEGGMLGLVKELINAKKPEVAEVLDLYFFQSFKPREIFEVSELDKRAINNYIYQFKLEVAEKLGK